MNCYIYNPGGSDRGPLTIEQLRAKLASGIYSPKEQVRAEETESWCDLSEVLSDVPIPSEQKSRRPPKDAQCGMSIPSKPPNIFGQVLAAILIAAVIGAIIYGIWVLYSQNEATKKASDDFDKTTTNAELYYRRPS
jgi:hypothetical protein